jgi:hypothetical protein
LRDPAPFVSPERVDRIVFVEGPVMLASDTESVEMWMSGIAAA